MAREGFRNDTIATVKARIGDEYVERLLQEMEARRLAREATLDFVFRHEPVVYYMRMDRLVKIGTTRMIRNRFSQIVPQGVLALELGDAAREKERHSQFWGHHSHGEWFWLHGELWAHVVHLREVAPINLGATTEEWLARHGVSG